MAELRILTTDQTFVDDLNAAGIGGVTAKYDPTMAYDLAEHLLEIVIGGIAAELIRLLRERIVERFKKTPPKQFTIVNSGNNAVNIINYVDSDAKPAQRKKLTTTKKTKHKKLSSK